MFEKLHLMRLFSGAGGGRRVARGVAAAVLIAVLAPFAIGDPSAFWRGLAVFQTVQPFRADSLSVTFCPIALASAGSSVSSK